MKNKMGRSGTVVAVSATVEQHPNGSRFRVNSAYTRALEDAGLTPFIAQPSRDASLAGEILELASGLVLTGGLDIDPSTYGEARHEATEEPSQLRDEWEAALVDAAREYQVPTLAICRGMQMVNVALGGSLMQDISSANPQALKHNGNGRRCRVHEVELDGGSMLSRIAGETRIQVNSMHHQGIRAVAPKLRVAARSPDGIVEGLEWPDSDWWMLAIQWHPEELVSGDKAWDRLIFAAFAEEVRRARGDR